MELRYLMENFNFDGTVVIKEWSEQNQRYAKHMEWDNMSFLQQAKCKDREVLYIYAEYYNCQPALIIELAID